MKSNRDCEATRLSTRKGGVSQQVTTVGRTMLKLTEPWRSRDAGESWVFMIQPYQTWEFHEMNVTLNQISSQCFARTNKVLPWLSTPLERIHTSTQLPDLNGANTRSLSADRTQLHKCKKRQSSSTRAHAHQPQQIITRLRWAMFSKITPLLALQHVAQNCRLRITGKMSESPLISASPPPRCSSHAQRSKGCSASTMKQGRTRL